VVAATRAAADDQTAFICTLCARLWPVPVKRSAGVTAGHGRFCRSTCRQDRTTILEPTRKRQRLLWSDPPGTLRTLRLQTQGSYRIQ